MKGKKKLPWDTRRPATMADINSCLKGTDDQNEVMPEWDPAVQQYISALLDAARSRRSRIEVYRSQALPTLSTGQNEQLSPPTDAGTMIQYFKALSNHFVVAAEEPTPAWIRYTVNGTLFEWRILFGVDDGGEFCRIEFVNEES